MRLGLPVGYGSERRLTKCNILQLTTRWSTSYTAFTNTASHLSKVTFYASSRLNNTACLGQDLYSIYHRWQPLSSRRERQELKNVAGVFSLLYSQWCGKMPLARRISGFQECLCLPPLSASKYHSFSSGLADGCSTSWCDRWHSGGQEVTSRG